MKEEILRDYCRWNQPDNARDLLSESGKDLDILYKNGIFFQLAISEQSTEMLSVLLNYYEKTRLSGEKESYAYKAAHNKLAVIIQEAAEETDFSEEMQEMLKEYLPIDQSSDDQDLSGFEDMERELDRLDEEGTEIGERVQPESRSMSSDTFSEGISSNIDYDENTDQGKKDLVGDTHQELLPTEI